MPVTAVRANPATPIGLARWLFGTRCLANVVLLFSGLALIT